MSGESLLSPPQILFDLFSLKSLIQLVLIFPLLILFCSCFYFFFLDHSFATLTLEFFQVSSLIKSFHYWDTLREPRGLLHMADISWLYTKTLDGENLTSSSPSSPSQSLDHKQRSWVTPIHTCSFPSLPVFFSIVKAPSALPVLVNFYLYLAAVAPNSWQ